MKKQLPAEAPPEAAEKGPGAGNATKTQKAATSQTPAFGMRAAVAAVSAAASFDVCKYEFYGFTRDVERRCVHKRDKGYVPPNIDVEPYVKRL